MVQQHRKSVVMVATLVLALVLLSGCDKTPVRPTAAPTVAPVAQTQCEVANSPQVIVTDDADITVCPIMDPGVSPQSGYESFAYQVPPSGVMHVMTRGGADRLILAAVFYTERVAGKTRGLLVFEQATTYDVESVPVQCSSKSLDATAQPQYAVVFVPSSDVLHPTEVPGDVQTVGNVTEVATDPIFGLPVTPEIADALCAQPASL